MSQNTNDAGALPADDETKLRQALAALERCCFTCAHIGAPAFKEPCTSCGPGGYAGWEVHEAHAHRVATGTGGAHG